MATTIPNQPIVFDEDSITCSCDSVDFIQLVDNTDLTQFQINIEPCGGAANLIDVSEWVYDTGWYTLDGGVSNCFSSVTGTVLAYPNLFTVGKYYQLNFTVTGLIGSFIVSDGMGVESTEVTSNGTYSIYFNILLANPDLIFTAANDSEFCLSSISTYEIRKDFIIPIYNSNDVYQTEISYANDPTYFTFANDTLTVDINWGELSLSNECFKIGILDPCINTNGQNINASITNEELNGTPPTPWSLGASWTANGTSVTGVYSGILTDDLLRQTNVFPDLITSVTVTIVISTLTGNAGKGLAVYFGQNLITTLTTVGTHPVTGIATSELAIRFFPTDLTTNVTIDSISVDEVTTDEYVNNFTSNTLKVEDFTGKCTLLLNACNDEDAFGFNFTGSGFTPRLRLLSKLKQAKYPTERNIYEDSLGEKKVIYASRKKTKNFVSDLLPEYIHDFLSTLSAYDRFYIDGVLYFVTDDEYNVIYNEANDDLGSISLQVEEKTQLIQNKNCGAEANVCDLPPNYLLQADDLSQFITLTDGELILING